MEERLQELEAEKTDADQRKVHDYLVACVNVYVCVCESCVFMCMHVHFVVHFVFHRFTLF